ncbi:MAG: hypothetical protein EBW04_07355 [Betaproteobacteria bacterium]|nr:hypothetical protein [Betaproteobacteria bacterium]
MFLYFLKGPINKFLKNFESRVYAELSKQLSEKLFGENASDSGTISILGNTVTYETIGQEIHMTITKTDGSTTTLVVPVGDFGF